MISEPLIYSVIKLKLDTELMKLQCYKATNSSTVKYMVLTSVLFVPMLCIFEVDLVVSTHTRLFKIHLYYKPQRQMLVLFRNPFLFFTSWLFQVH